ncbi:MAG TPA: DeoR/GlpR family DNA-binding transcription regulator [Leptolinea sp.]
METTIEYYPAERQQKILDVINQENRVRVARLVQLFGVSEVTIRSDLTFLASQNLIIRTHGGAVIAPKPPELSLLIRSKQMKSEKWRIGMKAASLVLDGDAIFLDTSSTSLAIAQQLINHRELTILTNSLAVAQTMLDAPSVTVVMPGGNLSRETVSLVGIDGLDLLKKFNIQKGFFGAHGISHPEGLTDVSFAEAEVKRQVLSICREVYAVVDNSKWGRVGLASFAGLDQIHQIITNQPIPPAMLEQMRFMGIGLILV